MGLRFRKSVKIAPGVKLNLNKKSVGVTVGGKGFKHTVNSSGRKTTTVGVPGTGVSYSNISSSNKSSNSTNDTQIISEEYHVPLSEQYESEAEYLAIFKKGKRQLMLLTIFLGIFGGHYFAMKRFGMGILYLLTGGLFLLGWIYDIVRFAGLKPQPFE